jgi:hypothetical protein
LPQDVCCCHCHRLCSFDLGEQPNNSAKQWDSTHVRQPATGANDASYRYCVEPARILSSIYPLDT